MLRKLTLNEFDEMFGIMRESFPDDEYRSESKHRELFGLDIYSVYGQYSDDGVLDGFITVWELENFTYVEHFAVAPGKRNGGIGSEIMGALEALTDKPICLEVELPNNDTARRRIGFYKRCGFSLNEYPYIQPSLGKGKSPVPLLIMTTGGEIDEECFAKLRDELYSVVYECK